MAAGLLSFLVQAQDYIDLEAQRATAKPTSPADPYAPRGAQAYPATSYGASNAPAATPAPIDAAVAPVGAQPIQAAAPVSGQDQNLGGLFMQIQQLQQQIMQINGKLEEQAHELRTLKEQSLQRYVDLDLSLIHI